MRKIKENRGHPRKARGAINGGDIAGGIPCAHYR
jgi:hypothetical protein